MKHLIAPSILAADFGNLQRDLEMINTTDADWFHVDIMDGRFVPNISFGPDIVKVVKKHAKYPLDVHLMIEEPEKHIASFVEAGADVLTVHYETCPHLHRTIQLIQDKGVKAGVALNPHTPVKLVENILEIVDLILIMSVNPGWGGQKFIYQSLGKIKELKEMRDSINSEALIEIDGGVGLHNAEAILKAGCDVLVAGSAVFKNENPARVVHDLKSIDLHTYLN